MKIATWNVNSLSVRLPHVLSWLKTQNPDVLALQETKVQDANFPVEALSEAGYHLHFTGEKSYNGVALLSKTKASDVVMALPGLSDAPCRFLAASVDDLRIINLYVPNGSEVGSEKYAYKLHWLNTLTKYIAEQQKTYSRLVLLGDFNIAPKDEDVHDPKAWSGSVLVSEAERDCWKALLSLNFVDAFRLHHKGDGHFSWWDYRMNAFARNHGLRIDHILISDVLTSRCEKVEIDSFPRAWERPSDHAPVIAYLV